MSLELVGVRRAFSGVVAVDGVSLEVRPGRALALLGANGAGKTTAVDLACGAVSPDRGQVLVDGRDLTGRGPRAFAAAGVVRSFQGLRLFETMTVLDNLLVGAAGARPLPVGRALLRTPGFRRAEQGLLGRAREALDEVGLGAAAGRPVTALSHGQRRRVELARALAAQPAYLVLDEPGAGLDPDAVQALGASLRRVLARGVGLLLVEHDPGLVERVADDVVVLAAGAVTARGTLAEVGARHGSG